jgi:hypothetical protein
MKGESGGVPVHPIKGTLSRDFLLLFFFHESVSPKTLSIPLGPFRIFSKIRGDIRSSRLTTGIKFATFKLPPVSTTPAANLATMHQFTSVVDTGGKFATDVNDTGGKFAAGVNDPGGKLKPVSTTPAPNLPPVSMTRWQTMGLISCCRYLKVNLKAKMYIYDNSTIQRCPNKIIKIFLIEDFFVCHWCR